MIEYCAVFSLVYFFDFLKKNLFSTIQRKENLPKTVQQNPVKKTPLLTAENQRSVISMLQIEKADQIRSIWNILKIAHT